MKQVLDSETLMTEVQSIHFKRRWYYALWCVLLLASLVALGLWETPVQGGTAELTFNIQIKNPPTGCTAQAWVGPRKRWPVADRLAPMTEVGKPLTAEGAAVGTLALRVGYRRWIGGILPRSTDDLVVVKFQPNGGTARYFAYPLDLDWHNGLLRPGRRMGIQITFDWDGLWLDPASVPKTS